MANIYGKGIKVGSWSNTTKGKFVYISIINQLHQIIAYCHNYNDNQLFKPNDNLNKVNTVVLSALQSSNFQSQLR